MRKLGLRGQVWKQRITSRRGKCHGGEHRQYEDTSYSDTTDSSSDSEENVSKQRPRRKIRVERKQSNYSKY
jgi:hypothetical protein